MNRPKRQWALLQARPKFAPPLDTYYVYEIPEGEELKTYSLWTVIGVFDTSAEANAMKALLE